MSSMLWFDTVLATMIVPAAPAPLAVAVSASGCAKSWDDVGANRIGCGNLCPSTVQLVSSPVIHQNARLQQ